MFIHLQGSALDNIPWLYTSRDVLKVKDKLGRCHDDKGHLVACNSGDNAEGQLKRPKVRDPGKEQSTFSNFGKPAAEEDKPKPAEENKPEPKPAEENPASPGGGQG